MLEVYELAFQVVVLNLNNKNGRALVLILTLLAREDYFVLFLVFALLNHHCAFGLEATCKVDVVIVLEVYVLVLLFEFGCPHRMGVLFHRAIYYIFSLFSAHLYRQIQLLFFLLVEILKNRIVSFQGTFLDDLFVELTSVFN